MEESRLFSSFAMNDIRHGLVGNTILSTELGNHATYRNISRSDFTYLGISKTSTIMAFTMSHTAFLHCIKGILFGSSKKQVIGTNTQAIVTMVTYLQAIRDWAIDKFIGYAMNKTRTTNSSHQSISAYCRSTYPGPACIGVRSVNLTPKALSEVTFAWGRMIGHLHNLLNRLVGVWLGLVQTASTPPHYTTPSRFPSSFMGV